MSWSVALITVTVTVTQTCWIFLRMYLTTSMVSHTHVLLVKASQFLSHSDYSATFSPLFQEALLKLECSWSTMSSPFVVEDCRLPRRNVHQNTWLLGWNSHSNIAVTITAVVLLKSFALWVWELGKHVSIFNTFSYSDATNNIALRLHSKVYTQLETAFISLQQS